MGLLALQFEVASPWRLAALTVAGVVLVAACLGTIRHSRQRRLAMTLCRAAVIACLALAWAAIAWRGPTSRQFVVSVEDRSASVAALDSRRTDVPSALAGATRLEFAGNTLAASSAEDVERMQSDPAMAVRRAAALVPADYVPALVLETDGRQTRAGLLQAASQVAGPVHVARMQPFAEPEVCLAEIRVPAVADASEPLDLDVVVTSNHEDQGQVFLDTQGAPRQERTVKLAPGENHVSFTAAAGDARSGRKFKATLGGFHDTFEQNNVRRAIVAASPRPSALLVASQREAAEPLREALAAGFEAAVATPGQIPQAAELKSFDLLVLCDVAPAEVAPAQQQAIEHFVSGHGGGLIVSGGPATLGKSSLQGTWLERLLPLSASERPAEQAPRLALVLIIDKSASMLEENRLGLAKEAARRTVQLDLIRPQDQVGVLAFSNASLWISPLEPCGDKRQPLSRIETLKAEGETNMGPALERAYLALRNADADRRHVIVLTDGVSSPAEFDAIAARMAAAGITVSTVALGSGAEETMLKDIAKAAGGRFYRCENPRDTPQILVAETRSAVGQGPAASFQPLVYRTLPRLDLEGAPPLRGFATTSPKPGAELLLLAPGGDPLLAWAPYGRGVVVALTSDSPAAAGAEGSAWQQWRGFGPFWNRLARHAVAVRPTRFNLSTNRRFGQLQVVLDAADPEGRPLNSASVALSVRPFMDGEMSKTPPSQRTMPQVAPGRYKLDLDASHMGLYEITVRVGGSERVEFQQTQTVAVDYADELKLGPADDVLLKEVATATGGRFAAEPKELLDQPLPPTDRVVQRRETLWAWFSAAALLLLLLDLTVRRLGPLRAGRQADERSQTARARAEPLEVA